MRVLIIGDIHGRYRELVEVLRRVQSDFGISAAIQVGDFGFYRESMSVFIKERIRFPVPVYVIDGNHEDHRWLHRVCLTGAVRVWKEEANLIYQPRASVIRLGSSTVGFLGGALHVDRPQKQTVFGWFPNYILRRQREQAMGLFNREQPELIVTHSCPAGIGIGVRGSTDMMHGVAEYVVKAGFDPGPEDDCGEMELAALWRGLTYRPRGWVFGHFHQALETRVGDTCFACVSDALDLGHHERVLWDTEEKMLLTVRL